MRKAEPLIPTFSPQGDGNSPTRPGSRLPRWCVDPYLFPARGRKPYGKQVKAKGVKLVDPYLFPARGRKRLSGGTPEGLLYWG